jgi:hypothetical protein
VVLFQFTFLLKNAENNLIRFLNRFINWMVLEMLKLRQSISLDRRWWVHFGHSFRRTVIEHVIMVLFGLFAQFLFQVLRMQTCMKP